MFLNFYLYLFILIFWMYYYSIFFNHIMLTLMCLEFIMLSILMLMMFSLLMNMMLELLMYYLVFVVCESVLGLTLLLLMIRSLGNDNYKFLNLILW